MEAVLEKKMNKVAKIREDFPILDREINGKKLVYLDNGATSQRPKQVIDSIVDFYSNYNANIHRGIHTLSQEASEMYEKVRTKTKSFLNAKSEKEIVFLKNTTEAINLVAHSWGQVNLKEGDEILLSKMEHHSNIIPFQILAKSTGAVLKFIDIDHKGIMKLDDIDNIITNKTKLVAVTHMSNTLGVINPVKKIIDKAHSIGAIVLLDGAQSVPHMKVDVQDLDCDFLAFSSHKMLGPTGVGVLYGKEELLESMPPFLSGGGMIMEVWENKADWAGLPEKFEAGTPNIAGVIAFGTAIDYLNDLGMEWVHEHEVELTTYALKRLKEEFNDINIYGPADATMQGGIISFDFDNIHPNDIGTMLDQNGIAIRTGHHCCQPLMKHYGISGTARASFYIYNTEEDVEAFIKGLKKVKSLFDRLAAKKKK